MATMCRYVRSLSRPLPSRSGAEEGTRTLTPLSWQRILSRSEAHPPSGSVRGVVQATDGYLALQGVTGLEAYVLTDRGFHGLRSGVSGGVVTIDRLG
jgi:hypothetical protein